MSILCRNSYKPCVTYKLWLIITKQHIKSRFRKVNSVEHLYQSTTITPYRNIICKRHFHNPSSLKVNSRVISEDKLVSQLTSASTTDNLFIMINSVDSLTPPQITSAFQTLDKLAFDQLMVQPWAIYADPILLTVQSFMNCESKEIFNPIIHCPEFDRLCYEAQNCRTSFSNSQLVTVTLCLTKLQVDLCSDVIRNLLLECLSRFESFDLDDLTQFSDAANFMKRSGFIVNAKIAQALQKRWKHLEASSENFLSVTKLLHSTGYFMTGDTLVHYQKKILEMLFRHSQALPLDRMLEMLDAINRFAGHAMPEIIDIVNFNLKKRLDELNVWYLPRVIGLQIHDWKISDKELMELVTKRSAYYFKGEMPNLRAADVVALVRMSHSQIPRKFTKLLEGLLEDCMGDLDAMLLKYVSGNFLVKTTNDSLTQSYCNQVEKKTKDLLESLSCLLNVTHCLSKIPMRSVNFDRVFSHHLMHEILEHQLGTQPKHVSTIGRYLVQCFGRNDLRSVGYFTERLIGVLPHLTLLDIANISLGIGYVTSSITTRTNHEQIVINFAHEILKRRDQIADISMLNLLVKCIFMKVNSVFRDAIIYDLEELYTRHMTTLRLTNVKPTCYLLRDLRLRIPALCERLVAIVTNRSEIVPLAEIAQTLDLLVRVNYRPFDLAALHEVAMARILELDHKLELSNQVMNILMVACSLARFHIFPEELIKLVFSLKFLTLLDEWNSRERGHFRSQHKMQTNKYLTELNCSVMLLCPHLGQAVAWFCNNYSLAANSRIDSNSIIKWKNSIYAGLIDAMGGEEYIKVGPLKTPYNHIYDFEFCLDKNGKPLPLDTNDAQLRVAIILTTHSNYCRNMRTLSGLIEIRAAQMEVLGFKVILVPYFHLDSMIMSDSESRRKYFLDLMASKNGS